MEYLYTKKLSLYVFRKILYLFLCIYKDRAARELILFLDDHVTLEDELDLLGFLDATDGLRAPFAVRATGDVLVGLCVGHLLDETIATFELASGTYWSWYLAGDGDVVPHAESLGG